MSDLPPWAAYGVAALVVTGSALSLLGATGLVSLKTFYDRVHAPTLGASLGGMLIVAGSIAFAALSEGRLVLHDLLLMLFITLTTPVTLILLARASIFRDRVEGKPQTPEET